MNLLFDQTGIVLALVSNNKIVHALMQILRSNLDG